MIKALIRLRISAGWSAPLLFISIEDRFSRVKAHIDHAGFIQAGLSKIQGLLKDFRTVFQRLKFMKNTDLSVKILLQKC